MEIERLKELRDEIAKHRAFLDRLCMPTTTETDLLALIDAEIASQSVTDGDKNKR